jgi:hypothetical protein
MFGILLFLSCVVTTSEVRTHHWWEFLLTGLGFSAFFSFHIVGLCLLPQRVRTVFLISMFVLQVLGLALTLAIAFLAQMHALTVLLSVISSSLWVLSVVIAVLVAFAIYGWCIRVTHHAAPVA